MSSLSGVAPPARFVERRRGQVVRRQTANLLFVGSIPTGASQFFPVPMRRILRRAIAVAVTLSVTLSTLGMAHACTEMQDQSGPGSMAATTAMADMAAIPGAHDDATMPHGACEHDSNAPADGSATTDSCLTMIGCAITMIVTPAVSSLTEAPLVARHAAFVASGPLGLPLPPDSPPPRA